MWMSLDVKMLGSVYSESPQQKAWNTAVQGTAQTLTGSGVPRPYR